MMLKSLRKIEREICDVSSAPSCLMKVANSDRLNALVTGTPLNEMGLPASVKARTRRASLNLAGEAALSILVILARIGSTESFLQRLLRTSASVRHLKDRQGRSLLTLLLLDPVVPENILYTLLQVRDSSQKEVSSSSFKRHTMSFTNPICNAV